MRPLGIGIAPPRAPALFPDAAASLASPPAATSAGAGAGHAHPNATAHGGSGTTATRHGEFGATTVSRPRATLLAGSACGVVTGEHRE